MRVPTENQSKAREGLFLIYVNVELQLPTYHNPEQNSRLRAGIKAAMYWRCPISSGAVMRLPRQV
jgi:hypothetical protein